MIMKEPEAAPQKIEIAGSGLGEVSDTDIDKRAGELARIAGRQRPHDGDFMQAREELSTTVQPFAPEAIAPIVEEIVTWDESPIATGDRAARGLPEDEANIGEQLVEEGIEEAEHDRRVSALDEQDAEDAE